MASDPLSTDPARGGRPTIAQVVHRIRTSVVHAVLPIVADPWNPHLLLMLWLGCHRFEQLVEALQISRSSLTQRLAQLQQEQCLWRDGEGGGHADYRLTPKGADLLGIVVLNRQWNSRWGLPNRVRPALRLRHACGAPLEARTVCAHCAAEVRARDVKILELPGAVPAAAPPPPAYRRARRQAAGRADAPAGALQGEDLAGDRWTALILAVAFMGLRRNSEIEQAIGIAPNVLAARLSLLTENQLFLRVQYQSHPARHEYHLTEKGLDRHAIVLAMVDWGLRWSGAAGRPDWAMLHKSCHEWLQPRIVCAACQGPVDAATLRAD